MLDDCDLLVIPLWIKFTDVLAIEQNFAFVRTVEVFNQSDDRALSTSRTANQSDNFVLVLGHLDGDTVQHFDVSASRVREVNIFDLEVSRGVSLDLCALLERWHVNQFLDSITSSIHLENRPQVQRQHHNVCNDRQQKEKEKDKHAWIRKVPFSPIVGDRNECAIHKCIADRLEDARPYCSSLADRNNS